MGVKLVESPGKFGGEQGLMAEVFESRIAVKRNFSVEHSGQIELIVIFADGVGYGLGGLGEDKGIQRDDLLGGEFGTLFSLEMDFNLFQYSDEQIFFEVGEFFDYGERSVKIAILSGGMNNA